MTFKIKREDRVQTVASLDPSEDFKNIPASEIGKRLSGKFGKVVGPVSGQDCDCWWVEHEQAAEPVRTRRASRAEQMQAQEQDAHIEKIWDRRGRMAPYKASELRLA